MDGAWASDPKALAAWIDQDAGHRQRGLMLYERGWISAWLTALGRIGDPSELSAPGADGLSPGARTERLLGALDPDRPDPRLSAHPKRLRARVAEHEHERNLVVTLRNEGRGHAWGDLALEGDTAGLELVARTFDGTPATIDVKVRPSELPDAGTHKAPLVVRARGHRGDQELRVPIRTRVEGPAVVALRWMGSALLALIALAWVLDSNQTDTTDTTDKVQSTREQALQEALEQERRRDANAGEYERYVDAIARRIQQTWVRPANQTGKLTCAVSARLLPGGAVAEGSVTVDRPSGSTAFDQSVVRAFYAASPLPVPSGPAFNQFRDLQLAFEAEGDSTPPPTEDRPAIPASSSEDTERYLGLDRAERTQVEQWLAALGRDPGAVDGDFDAATRQAMRAFQRSLGQEASGYLNRDQYAALRQAGEVARRTAPKDRETVTAKPSFDCTKAREQAEKLICGSEGLAALDRELAGHYSRLQERLSGDVQARLRREQLTWLGTRNRCSDQRCIERAYRRRIAELERGLSSGMQDVAGCTGGLLDGQTIARKLEGKTVLGQSLDTGARWQEF